MVVPGPSQAHFNGALDSVIRATSMQPGRKHMMNTRNLMKRLSHTSLAAAIVMSVLTGAAHACPPSIELSTNIPGTEHVTPTDEVQVHVHYSLLHPSIRRWCACDVVVEVQLAEHLIFVSATGGGTYDPGTHAVSWAVSTMCINHEAIKTIHTVVSGNAESTEVLVSSAEIRSDNRHLKDWKADDEASVTVFFEDPECGNGIIEGDEQCEQDTDCPASFVPEASYACNECMCQFMPVAIELDYFTAAGISGAIEIKWGTESEIDNAGFNILRSQAMDGEYVQINDLIIPAVGDSSQGSDYSYTDNDVRDGTTYWYVLEDMNIFGEGTLHGPVTAAKFGQHPQQQQSWGVGSTAEGGNIGQAGSTLFNYCYVASVALLFVGLWLAIVVRRGRKRVRVSL